MDSRARISSAYLNLPELSDGSGYEVPAGAVVILAAGFEDRAVSAARALGGLNEVTILLLHYTHDEPNNRLDEIVATLRGRGVQPNRVVLVPYDRLQPDDYPPLLKATLANVGGQSVCIDISAMTKLALMLTLDVCREDDKDVVVYYTEARDYGPSLDDYNLVRQTAQFARPTSRFFAGVQDVVRVRRLSSVAIQGQPSAAIVFMSFNELLTQALIDTVSPTRLFLINGKPPLLQWREEATAWIHDQLRREWPEADNPVDHRGLPQRSTSTLNYQETVVELLDLYWQLASTHRILLAPTGSKMQAVAVALVRFIHPDIHVEYPVPNGDLNLQGTGVGRSWQIRFGKLGTECVRWSAQERDRRLTVAL